MDCSEDDCYGYEYPGGDMGSFIDSAYQAIKWSAHQPNGWATALDEREKET